MNNRRLMSSYYRKKIYIEFSFTYNNSNMTFLATKEVIKHRYNNRPFTLHI
jgi:hypothetical protein